MHISTVNTVYLKINRVAYFYIKSVILYLLNATLKLGGPWGNRTPLDTMIASQRRNPLLSPILKLSGRLHSPFPILDNVQLSNIEYFGGA